MSLPPEILLRTFGTEVRRARAGRRRGHPAAPLLLPHHLPRHRADAGGADALPGASGSRHYLAIYKGLIRPILLRMAGSTITRRSSRRASRTRGACWSMREPDRSAAVAAVFRTSSAAEHPDDEYLFRPRGLQPGGQYKITLDNSGLSYRATGADLALAGVPVRARDSLCVRVADLRVGHRMMRTA